MYKDCVRYLGGWPLGSLHRNRDSERTSDKERNRFLKKEFISSAIAQDAQRASERRQGDEQVFDEEMVTISGGLSFEIYSYFMNKWWHGYCCN